MLKQLATKFKHMSTSKSPLSSTDSTTTTTPDTTDKSNSSTDTNTSIPATTESNNSDNTISKKVLSLKNTRGNNRSHNHRGDVNNNNNNNTTTVNIGYSDIEQLIDEEEEEKIEHELYLIQKENEEKEYLYFNVDDIDRLSNGTSDYILFRIFSQIDDNIDKICLILTCKKLYMSFKDRTPLKLPQFNNYYYNNEPKLVNLIKDCESKFCMKSFRTSVNNQIDHIYCTDDPQLEQIPPTSTDLIISNTFNRPLQFVLPQHLTRIRFGDQFDEQIILGTLPNSITHLTFGHLFNQMILPFTLPLNLEYIKFGRCFNQPFPLDSLRPSLRRLEFEPNFEQKLSHITLPRLKHVVIGLKNMYRFSSQALPQSDSLHTLELVSTGQVPILRHGAFPFTIRNLSFDYCYCDSVSLNILPQHITHLTLSPLFNSVINPGDLPDSLTHINLGMEFNVPLKKNGFPINVTHITFSFSFNQRLVPGQLPEALQYLKLGYMFDSTIAPGALPKSLKHIVFGRSFNQDLGPNVLPRSLEHIEFGFSFNTSDSTKKPHLELPTSRRLQYLILLRKLEINRECSNINFILPIPPSNQVKKTYTAEELIQHCLESKTFFISRNTCNTPIQFHVRKVGEKLYLLLNEQMFGGFITFNSKYEKHTTRIFSLLNKSI